jgi:hypothetical protein
MRPNYFTLISAAVLVGSIASAGSINLYIGAPGATGETSPIAGTTATFDSIATGNYSSLTSVQTGGVGTYTSAGTFTIMAPNGDGGAFNGGTNSTTNYLAFGSESGSASPVTVTFASAQTYFGFWLSAADVNNSVALYSSGTQVAQVNASSIINTLTTGGTTVTSVGGTNYTKTNYLGNPNNSLDPTSVFVYVMIVASGGATFDKAVLSNGGSLATGFESDNQTIAAGTITIPNAAVLIGSVATPEPSEAGAVALALGMFALAMRKRTA